MKDAILTDIRNAVGNGSSLARELGLTRQAIYQWWRVPAEYVLRVESISGVPRHRIRPDLYPEDRELPTDRPPEALGSPPVDFEGAS